MNTEIEAQFLDIYTDQFREKLVKAGAKMIHPEILMKRKLFDYPDGRLRKIGGWIRVRKEFNKVTLSYKQLNDRTLFGTKEVVLEVSNFDTCCQFLIEIGLEQKSYQETKRESWKLKNTDITIDTWPWIPSFVELESQTEQEVKQVAKELGFNWKKAIFGSVENAYQAYYDVTEEEVDSWTEMIFAPKAPVWLEARRKKI